MTLDLEKDSDLVQLIASIARDAQTSLWNALLTLNGILIGAISIFVAFAKVNKYIAIALILCSVISSALLIWNFKSLVDSSQTIIVHAMSPEPLNPRERIKANQKVSGKRFRRTAIAQYLVLIEFVLLFVILSTL